MRVVIQRVSNASVSINSELKSSIQNGLLVLLGVTKDDEQEDIVWLSNKISNMRIFADENGVMNKSIIQSEGDIIVVSQFTLMAQTKKGNRPSYINAAPADISIPIYETFVQHLSKQIGKEVLTGEFGADMDVSLTNDGPVTIIIDSKNRDL